MAPHSSTLAWKIPWMEEPGRLQSMGSQRVRYDSATSLSLFTFMHWRRKWQPTPVFLPGESQRRGVWWAAVYGVAQSRTLLKRLSSSSSSRYGKMQWNETLYWTITRRQVSRDLWLLRPSPVIAHWVSYRQKPSSELGTSLSSNKGQNGHEMPPKVWSDLWPQGGCVNYKLALIKSTANDWTTKAFAICLHGDWTPCCLAVDLQLPVREFKVEWGTLCSRESGRMGL